MNCQEKKAYAGDMKSIKKNSNSNNNNLFDDFFSYNIKRGIFYSSYCKQCRKCIFPNSRICPTCLNLTIWKNLSKKIGILREYTGSYFSSNNKILPKNNTSNNNNIQEIIGIVEISGIKILAKIIDNNNILKYPNTENTKKSVLKLKLTKCGFIENDDSKLYFEFTLI